MDNQNKTDMDGENISGVMAATNDSDLTSTLTTTTQAPDCGNYDLVMNALVKFILVGFGTIGNSLSIVVMWSERNTSATAFLLIVLAVVDTCLMYTWTFIVTATGESVTFVSDTIYQSRNVGNSTPCYYLFPQPLPHNMTCCFPCGRWSRNPTLPDTREMREIPWSVLSLRWTWWSDTLTMDVIYNKFVGWQDTLSVHTTDQGFDPCIICAMIDSAISQNKNHTTIAMWFVFQA